MSGSLSQLAAKGVQSGAVYCNEFTSFKCKVSKPSSFAREPKEIVFNGTTDYGKTMQAQITYSADLLTRLFLVMEVNATSTTNSGLYDSVSGNGKIKCAEDFAHAVIEEAKLEIGSVQHNIFDGMYMHVKDTLHMKDSHKSTEWTGRTSSGGGDDIANCSIIPFRTNKFYVDLPFWFTEDHCQALPLVAMHLSQATITIKMRKRNEVIMPFDGGSGAALSSQSIDDVMDFDNIYLMGEYIYLNDSTRLTFANLHHYFLITQVQTEVSTVAQSISTHRQKLNFNHMVKSLWWFARDVTKVNGQVSQDYFNFEGEETGASMGTRASDFFKTCAITLNSNERVKALDPIYYRLVQPHICYLENVPDEFIYQYNFALTPQKHAPSGGINLSRIETTELVFNFTNTLANSYDLFVIAVGYNVVSIRAGVASVLFAS